MSQLHAALAVAAAIAVINSACGGNGGYGGGGNGAAPGQAGASPPPTQSVPPSPTPGNWTGLTERTACEAMNPAYCIGAYGFQVSADGSFAAGPDPGGKTVTGQITPPELQTLNGDVAQLTQADLNASLVCQGSHIIPGVMDEVTLQNGSQTYTLYEGNSVSLHGSDCVSGDPAKEERLHSDLNAIMKEYYPVPFPSGNIPGPTPTASP